MTHAVAQTAPSRNRRSVFDYTDRQLRIMFIASEALLGGRLSGLSASDLQEAERLLEDLPATTDDADDDPHDPGCGCWRCDDEPAYRAEDEADDMEREIAAVRRVA